MLLVLAIGMTFVIITAGIDLSVGSVLVFAGVVSAKAMNGAGRRRLGRDHRRARRRARRAASAWGLINGFLVAKAQDPRRSSSRSARSAWPSAWRCHHRRRRRCARCRSSSSPTIGTGRAFGQVPWLVLIASAVAIVFGVILAATRFGRHTYAIGSNEEAARRAGIPVDRHLIEVYALAGTLAGLAGFLAWRASPRRRIGGHATDNLQAIAAVVIGGTSLFGGIGTMLGTVFGVFIPAVLQNGFVIIGVKPFWQRHRRRRGAHRRRVPRPIAPPDAVPAVTVPTTRGGGQSHHGTQNLDRCSLCRDRSPLASRPVAATTTAGRGGGQWLASAAARKKNYKMTLIAGRQGRRVLHHDELRGPGQGQGARRHARLPGPGQVRRRPADADRQRGRGQEARRGAHRADRHQGDVRADQAAGRQRLEGRARRHHARAAVDWRSRRSPPTTRAAASRRPRRCWS